MKISLEGLKLLEDLEGKEYETYPDSEGYLTIGIGHLITEEEKRSGFLTALREDGREYKVSHYRTLDDEAVYDILRHDLVEFVDVVNDNVRVPLTQNQFDALVSFAFNVGSSAFRNSTLLKMLNSGQYDKVPTQMIRWVFARKKVVNGLVNRRNAEIDYWENIA